MKTFFKKSTSKIYLLSLITLLTVVIIIGFSFYVDKNEMIVQLKIEKNNIIKDLKISKYQLSKVKSDNAVIQKQLSVERQKVDVLIDEVGNSNLDISSILKLKNEVFRLNRVVTVLVKEKDNLIKKNQFYKSQRDSVILVLGNSKLYKDSLNKIKEYVSFSNTLNSDFKVINPKMEPFYRKDDTDEFSIVNKSSKVNVIKATFFINTRIEPKTTTKSYFIQIINKQGNVIGMNKLMKFGKNELYYSWVSRTLVQEKLTPVVEYVPVSNLIAGKYEANIFEKDKLVSQTSFVLK